MHFWCFQGVFELMSDSLMTIKIEPHQCPSHQSILLTQGMFSIIFWEPCEIFYRSFPGQHSQARNFWGKNTGPGNLMLSFSYRLKLHNQNNTNLLLQGKALIRPIAFRPTPGPNSGASTPTNGPLGSYVRPGSSNGNNESLVPIVGLLARASPAQGPFNVPVRYTALHSAAF